MADTLSQSYARDREGSLRAAAGKHGGMPGERRVSLRGAARKHGYHSAEPGCEIHMMHPTHTLEVVWLAVERTMTATQNQALSAVLFLYRDVMR